MDRLAGRELARQQIEFARKYTLSLLEGLDDEDWFRQPPGMVTHIAWQVGHLAMAEYGLCLFRIRGRRSEDLDLMPGRVRKQFSRGSTPVADPARYPSPAEIVALLDRIHQQSLDEILSYDAAVLGETMDEPYAVEPTKLGALFFCSHHEMIHAGQIGVLRRLFGKSPVR